jgi:predicted phage baseplate assembly protein
VNIDDDAKAEVVFGDGERGARVPTGVENVTATYRSGIGFAGQVAARRLTLLQTRPAGVRDVVNPVAATGADDPEKLSSARENAPLTVLTLDRIVSVRDFEDFARAFAGIGKAQAVALHRGETLLVHLTVAAADGSRFEKTSERFVRLVDAIALACDPTQRFQVDPHQPHFFDVTATVAVDPRHRPAAVRDGVRAALLDAFSFPERAFGQPVTAAEVIAVIHRVPGVVATDLERLARVDEAVGAVLPAPPPVVAAERARLVGGEIVPGQLLLVNPAGVSVKEMSP